MNMKIVVIEDNLYKISETLGYIGVEYNNQTKDIDIHNWLIPQFLNLNNVEKIIIPLRLGLDDSDYKGLRIGLHIRLSKELGNKRYLPIIFITGENKETVISNQIKSEKEKTGMLLFTSGIYLTSINELSDKIDKFSLKIDRQTMLRSVLPNLIVENQRDLGHQLANEWGVFRLAKFAGIELNIEKPADLFFKYKYAFSETDIKPIDKNSIGLLDENCNILLIDDNADKGWGKLLSEILKKRIILTGKKCNVDSILSYENADLINDYEKYDIVFLDLRLKLEEDKPNTNLPITKYSGYKLLKKIKAQNQGIQVIILTASNKAWNMRELLDAGADGYYIKESPEYNFSDSFSEQNYLEFKQQIEKCFQNSYLKDIYSRIKVIKENIDKTSYASEFINELKNQMDLAFTMLQIASKNDIRFKKCISSEKTKEEKQFAYAFISLHAIIEIINKQFVSKKEAVWLIDKTNKLFDWEWNKKEKRYKNTGKNANGYEIEKIVGICIQRFEEYEYKSLRSIELAIKKRNYFIHNDIKNLDYDIKDKYINHDIYTSEAFKNLFDALEKILNLL